ncbi:MAG: hypothetical protein N2449_02100 [Bacteroidales bacterium]|nr:hypothetical protein [Bacteroidales bacterium]
MGTLHSYLQRHALYAEFIKEHPSDNLGICVVIPCYNEPTIFPVLKSLAECHTPTCDVEIIVVINGKDSDTYDVWEKNNYCENEFFSFVRTNHSSKLKFYLIRVNEIPKKYAGVGHARKIGMDESIRRFIKVANDKGIICSLDVDCKVEKNYFQEIEYLFSFCKAKACSIRFEHAIEGDEFSANVYDAIVKYELYLHYHLLALKYAGHPFAYHTIGSAMAVRADVYAMQGGMNQRQAGEDFYFLQKIIPLGNFFELNNTCIFPSPRISERVPFGTGMSIKKILENNEWMVYNPQAYNDLKQYFILINDWYKDKNISLLWTVLPETIKRFISFELLNERLHEIENNTSNFQTFQLRFFRWFNMFQVIKWLNYVHQHQYNKLPVNEAVVKFLQSKNHSYSKNEKENLLLLRQMLYNDKRIVIY